MNPPDFSRRRFLQLLSTVTAWAVSGLPAGAKAAPAAAVKRVPARLRKPCIAIQTPAASFADEGVDKVLDTLREKAHVNTVWLGTYAYDRGAAGRQLRGYPFPDHGPQEPDEFYGGAFFDYDRKYFRNTALKDFRSPDYQDRNILAEVLPKAKERNMDVIAWDFFFPERQVPQKIRNFNRVVEIDVHGKPTWAPCNNNEDYRQHMFGRVECYLRQYPDLAGIAWCQERMGPLMNMIGGTWGQPFISCFCPDCLKKAKARGISADRARLGYIEMEKFIAAAKANVKPNDGYFVTFWRLLTQYPEILAWEKLWTDSYQEIRAEVYRIAKSIAPEKPVGFHILHNATLSPFYRAEEDYTETKKYADFVKPAIYNTVGGGRMALFLDRMSGSIFHDATPEDVLPFYYKIMDYKEAPYTDLARAGLTAESVGREVKRIITASSGELAVYPGVEVGIPDPSSKRVISPDDVREAVKAAFTAGAPGVVLSRKYSEMRLGHLAAAGQGMREAGVI